jgi:hypothetical protein
MTCPVCKAPATHETKRCAYCRATLRLAQNGVLEPVFPDVKVGDPVRLFYFPRDPLPGGYGHKYDSPAFSVAPAHDGMMLSFSDNRAVVMADSTVRLRDGCVKATFTVLEPGLNIGLSARFEDLERTAKGVQAETGYVARIEYPDQQMVLLRSLTYDGNTKIGLSTIREIKNFPPPPFGQRVVLELLVEGPTIIFRVNDRTVMTAHDYTYGIGCFGMRVGRFPQKDNTVRRAVVHDFGMAMVAR